MQLYFSPLACSLATRIALYEAGLDGETEFHNVTLSTKRYDGDRGDFLAVNPKGQVPALVTRDGALLTENAAVLQYVADLAPDARLAPPAGTFARLQLQQWLSYIATELHKRIFHVAFDPEAPAEAKRYALAGLPKRLAYVEATLAAGATGYLVGDAFTVADAYLATVLTWCRAVNVDLPAPLAAYRSRIAKRPNTARAFTDEMALAGR